MYGSYSPSNSSMLLHSHHIAFNHRKPTNTTRMWLIFESVHQEMRFDQKQGKSLTTTPKDHGDSSYKVSQPSKKARSQRTYFAYFSTSQSLPKRVRFHNKEKDTSPATPTKLEETFFFLLLCSCETDRRSSFRRKTRQS